MSASRASTFRRYCGGVAIGLLGVLVAAAGWLATPSDGGAVVPGSNGKIAFDSNRTGNDEVFVMGSNVSNQVNISNDPASDRSPTWSPDGARIAFASDRSGDTQIWVMDADGDNPQQLTELGGQQPAWSPDGTMIAFWTFSDLSSEVFVMNADGSNETDVSQNPTSQDQSPTWSPD